MDHLLNGGYEEGVVSTLYGPAGCGKSTLCLLALIEVASQGKKVIYIDTEGGFSVERLKQLCKNYEEILSRVIFLKPTTFAEQKKAFEKLRGLKKDNIGLIIVDTIVMLYRLELGKNEDVYATNRELSRQISYLTEITRKKGTPILITNQVYSNFDEKDKVNMVGGDILKYWSKCLVELQITPNRKRRAVLRKHRSLPEGKQVLFEIKNSGLLSVSKNWLFR